VTVVAPVDAGADKAVVDAVVVVTETVVAVAAAADVLVVVADVLVTAGALVEDGRLALSGTVELVPVAASLEQAATPVASVHTAAPPRNSRLDQEATPHHLTTSTCRSSSDPTDMTPSDWSVVAGALWTPCPVVNTGVWSPVEPLSIN
jgi:hypothetical protein